MTEISENHQVMKQAIRSKIFNQSELMSTNLQKATQFVYSKQHPTQVIDIKGTRYLRINDADIQEDTIDDLLGMMLAIDSYQEGEDIESDRETIIRDSITLNKDLDGEDITASDLIELDEYENITNLDELPIKPQVVKAKPTEKEKEEEKQEEEELKEEEASSGLTKEAKSLDSAMSGDDTEVSVKKQEYKADVEIEQALDEVDSMSTNTEFQANRSVLSAEEIKKLNTKAQKLLKAFKGYGGKVKRLSPSKRTCAKSMAMDRDKVYYKNKADEGKHIKLNFLIDMSGSMSGEPVKNAVSLVYIFNILAKEGYLDMTVLYSMTRYNYKLELPASPAQILSLNQTGSAEGLARTVHEHVETLQNTNLVCLTDGNICDEGIDKAFWSKHRIISTGVYVNKSAKDLREYTGTLNKWFSKSVVRSNLDELIEYLIKTGLK